MTKLGLIYWTGFPVSSTLTKNVISNHNVVLATENIDSNENANFFNYGDVIALKDHNLVSLFRLFSKYDYIFVSGWHGKYAAIIHLISMVKGIPLILMMDNIKKNSVKQSIAKIFFELGVKRFYRYYFVPGLKSLEYLIYLGVDKDKIYDKYYGANEEIFTYIKPYSKRENEFVFVGQLIQRKSIVETINGYLEYHKGGGTWGLRIIGDGVLTSQVESMTKECDSIYLEGKLTPELIAIKLNNARALCLFSVEDHWATVLVEACACGLPIIASKSVGAVYDVINSNGYIIESSDVSKIAEIFHKFSNLSDGERVIMSNNSRNISNGYNSFAFKKSFDEIVGRLF